MRWIAFLSLLLAGCVSTAPIGGETEPDPATLSPSQDVNFEQCTGSVAFSLQPFSAADAYLPPGYQAEDASVFFGATAGVPLPEFNQALFALVFTDCTMSHTGNEELLVVAWIFLEHPEAAWVNNSADFEWYELQRYTQGDTLPNSLDQFQWDAEVGNITTGIISQPPYLAARFWNLGAPSVFSMSHEGSGAPISATGHHRTWNAHVNGTTTYDFDLDASLLLGPGVCTAEPGHWTWEFIGGGCGDVITLVSPDIQYAAFADLQLIGSFHMERDSFVV